MISTRTAITIAILALAWGSYLTAAGLGGLTALPAGFKSGMVGLLVTGSLAAVITHGRRAATSGPYVSDPRPTTEQLSDAYMSDASELFDLGRRAERQRHSVGDQ